MMRTSSMTSASVSALRGVQRKALRSCGSTHTIMQLGPLYFDARRYEDAISTLEKLHSNLALQASLSARTDSKSFFAVLTIR
jgi:hypothetical protein